MTPHDALRRLVEADRQAQIRPTLVEAPCLWCGYNGPGYWQPYSHAVTCPWYEIGGSQERMDTLPRVVAAQAAHGAGFDVEKAMDYAKGYQDGQQIMATKITDLRARLAAVEAERGEWVKQVGALATALARYGRHECDCEDRAHRPDERLRLAVLGAADEDFVRSVYPCTCGLDAAREGA